MSKKQRGHHLLHKTNLTAEVGSISIDGLTPDGRLAGIKTPWFKVAVIQERKCTKNGVIRQYAANKDHKVGTYKKVGTNHNLLAIVAIVLQVKGVAEQLGVVAGDGGVGTDLLLLVQSMW